MAGQPEIGGLSALISHADFKHTTGAANTVTYSSFFMSKRGETYSVSAGNGVSVPSTDANTGEALKPLGKSQACALLFSYDPDLASGNLRVSQGPIVDLDVGDSIRQAPRLGGLPEGAVPLGYVVVGAHASRTAGFTFGTTNWNTSNVTVKSGTLATLPDRPPVTSLS